MNYLQQELFELIKTDPTIFKFLSGAFDGIGYRDLENPENEWGSPQFWALLGHNPSEKQHLAKERQELVYQDDLQAAQENLDKHLEDPFHPYDQIVRYEHQDGSTVWVRCRGLAIRDENGKPTRMLCVQYDVTQMKRQEEIIQKQNNLLKELKAQVVELSITDDLTKLYNRRHFQKELEFMTKTAVRQNRPLSLVIINVDHFKQYNDTYGYSKGDNALVAFAWVLTKATRETDILARIGGKEFGVILPDTDKQGSILACERYMEALDAYNWPRTKLTASFGIETIDGDMREEARLWDTLFINAEIAMYYSKERGRNQWRHYENVESGEIKQN